MAIRDDRSTSPTDAPARRTSHRRRPFVLAPAAMVLSLALGCASEPSTSTAPPATSGTTAAAPGPSTRSTGPGTTAGTVKTTTGGTTGGTTGSTRAPGTSRPTTSTTGASSSSSAPPGSAASATPTTPEGYAKALVAAWAADDRAAAAQVAEAAAVTKLFAFTDQDAAAYRFLDCGGAAGSTICRFNAGSETLLVSVRNTTGGQPIIVTDVRITGAGG